MTEQATVLRVGAEGGSLAVRRVGEGKEERYLIHICETNYGLDELEAVDEDLGEADSLAEALNVMDRYPWSRLTVVEISPDAEAQVLSAVEQREGKEGLERWVQQIASLRAQSKT